MENIISNEITLKPIDINDIELIRQWRNNESDNKTFINSKIITAEEQIRWYENYRKKSNDIMYIIFYNIVPIGTIALYDIDYKNRKAEFGRLLIGDTSNRGKKFGEKATKILCQYGLNKLKLNQIILEVFEDNIYAYNVYEQAGFKKINEKYNENRKIIVMEIRKDEI